MDQKIPKSYGIRSKNGQFMKKHILNFIYVVILIFYCVYAGIYIFRTSFESGGERYFVLFDDAMISMRYAKNLADGNGLVWNPGEDPVEGFTNPLWVIFMAVFHLLPISPSKMSLPSSNIFMPSGLILLTCKTLLIPARLFAKA